MSYEEDQLREAVFKWFANKFEGESFKISMGDGRVQTIGMKITLSFLAQAVAYMGMIDEKYFAQLVAVHGRLKLMSEKLEKNIVGRFDIAYQFALIVGTIIELAGEATEAVKKDGH